MLENTESGKLKIMPEYINEPVDGAIISYEFIDPESVIFRVRKGDELYYETYTFDTAEKVD